jgi:DnaJ-class molecular chaperone
VFVLETLPHPAFKRNGSDLTHKAVLPLYHALEGSGITLKLLNGKQTTIPIDHIITPGYTITVPGLGLPVPGQDGRHGNLTITIDVLFPTRLSDSQKMLMKAAFYLPGHMEDGDPVRTFRTAFQDPVTGWEACVTAKRK